MTTTSAQTQPVHHPAVAHQLEKRAGDFQLKVAGGITAFAGIGQNRQATFQQEKADHDFVAQEQELSTNTELTKKIHELTVQLHAKMCLAEDGPTGGSARAE